MKNQQEEELIVAFRRLKPSSKERILFHIKNQTARDAAGKPQLTLIVGGVSDVSSGSQLLKVANKI
jgi:hypothetical protein